MIVALIGYIEGKFQIVPHLFRIANLDVVVNHLLVAQKEIIEISHLGSNLHKAQDVPDPFFIFTGPDIMAAHKVQVSHIKVLDLTGFPIGPMDGVHHLIDFTHQFIQVQFQRRAFKPAFFHTAGHVKDRKQFIAEIEVIHEGLELIAPHVHQFPRLLIVIFQMAIDPDILSGMSESFFPKSGHVAMKDPPFFR